MEIILQLLHMMKRLLNIQKLAEEHNIPRDQFEFQMLYGIRNERQLELVKEGYKMRVYVPYGNDWYGFHASSSRASSKRCVRIKRS